MARQIIKWASADGREWPTEEQADRWDKEQALATALERLNVGQRAKIDAKEIAERLRAASNADVAAITAALDGARQR